MPRSLPAQQRRELSEREKEIPSTLRPAPPWPRPKPPGELRFPTCQVKSALEKAVIKNFLWQGVNDIFHEKGDQLGTMCN